MKVWPFGAVLAVAAVGLVGCARPERSMARENSYAAMTEKSVRAMLGEPSEQFAGHYGLPPMKFRKQFNGEIKTLVFEKPGGAYYVSFEKRPAGWVSICSSWLPAGAEL